MWTEEREWEELHRKESAQARRIRERKKESLGKGEKKKKTTTAEEVKGWGRWDEKES